jgi:hypothetical protein
MTVARPHQTRFKSSKRAREVPRDAEIRNQIGKVLKAQYEPPRDLPHKLLTLLMQLNSKDDD